MRSFVSSRLGALARVDFTQSWGVDPRSLALFRIALALVLLSDLWLRIANMEAFYTDIGLLPRVTQIELYGGLPALLTFHLMNGTMSGQAFLFAIQVGAALALLVGYRTWMATLISWIWMVSLHNRNPMVLQGGDVLLRMMLFWALFLPLNVRASLDRWLAPPAEAATDGSLAAYKSADRANASADGANASADGANASADGANASAEASFEAIGGANQIANVSVEAANGASPLAAALARSSDALRRGSGIGVQRELYPDKPFVSLGTVAALLQVCFVYWFSWALKTDASWRVDGTAVGYALSIDQLNLPLGRWLLLHPDLMRVLSLVTINLERFGPLVALLPFWRSRLLMVLIFTGFHWTMGLCLTLGIFTWISPTAWLLFVPTGAWDWLEAHISFGRVRAASERFVAFCRRLGMGMAAPRRTPLWRNMSGQMAAIFFLLYAFGWNLRALDFDRYEPYFQTRWNWIGEALRLDQVWSMFAPFPLKEDGWMVMPAKLADGREVNLINDGRPSGAPMSWEKPPNLSRTFRDAQWQKYVLNLWTLENAPHRGYYVAFTVRKWNESHPPAQRVKSTQLVYIREDNLEGFRKAKAERIPLWDAKY